MPSTVKLLMLSVKSYGAERQYCAWQDVRETHAMGPFPDFGDVQDNATALHIAMHEIVHGNMAWGCEVLVRLRDYICATKEVKSLQWVLPQVEAALQRFGEPSNTPRWSAASS